MNSYDFTEKPMIRFINRVIVMTLLSCSHVNAGAASIRFHSAFNKGQYISPEINQLKQISNAFQQELAGQSASDLWNALAMLRISQNNVLFFQESADRLKGRGLFAIRQSADVKPWLLQAPHAKSDKYTGEIAALLFDENQIKAAMWNSVHRKTSVNNSNSTGTADMAHLPGTYWQAVTEVFARDHDNGRIIQLHGFDQSKRQSTAGRKSEIIVSAGHRHPPSWVKHVADCLRQSLNTKISLYPDDVKELGATTNTQGQLLKKLGFKGFLHIEMSRSMRENLLSNKNLRQLFMSCINE